VTNWRIENNWGQQEEFDRFNQEVAEATSELNKAKEKFEATLALSLPLDSSEIKEVGETTRHKIIIAAKSTLRSACNNNYLQYLEINRLSEEKSNAKPKRNEEKTFTFYDYLHYWEPKETAVRRGKYPVEAVGFRLVEGITDDGEPYGDEMHVRFVLPRHFLLSANIGDIETENWFGSIDEVFIEYDYNPLKNKLPEVFSVRLDSFINHNKSLENLKKQIKEVESPQDILGKDSEKSSLLINAIDIYQKFGTMKLFYFLKRQIEI